MLTWISSWLEAGHVTVRWQLVTTPGGGQSLPRLLNSTPISIFVHQLNSFHSKINGNDSATATLKEGTIRSREMSDYPTACVEKETIQVVLRSFKNRYLVERWKILFSDTCCWGSFTCPGWSHRCTPPGLCEKPQHNSQIRQSEVFVNKGFLTLSRNLFEMT